MANNADVYLEVPNLSVDQILLDVNDVQVHLSLATMYIGISLLAAFAFWFGLAPARRAVEAAT